MEQSATPRIDNLLTTWYDLWDFSWKTGINTGTNRAGWFLLTAAISLYIISQINLFAPARLLWAYCVVRALWIVEFPLIHYGISTLAFVADAGANLVEVILIPAFALFLPYRAREKLWYSFRWFSLFLLLCVWMGWRGFQIAPTFNMALVALYLPFGPLWLWPVALVTILSKHAATAQAMLAVQLIIFAWKRLPYRWSIPLGLFMPLVTLAVVAYHAQGHGLDAWGRLDRLNVHGRFVNSWLYSDYTGATHHLNWPNILLGVGPGSFARISTAIDHFQHPLVLFLHNEGMQIPWELGIFALLLALIVYSYAVWNCWQDVPMLCSLASLFPFLMLWHPFRYAASAVFVALLFERALDLRVSLGPMLYGQFTGRLQK